MLYCFLTAAVVTGCASTQVSLETDFPSPLVEKQSTPIALIINKSLTDFVHTETVEKGGDFVIEVGSAQRALFERLAAGLFSNHTFVDSIGEPSISALAIESLKFENFNLLHRTKREPITMKSGCDTISNCMT